MRTIVNNVYNGVFGLDTTNGIRNIHNQYIMNNGTSHCNHELNHIKP